MLKKLLRNKKGQAMTEYVIIVCLIAVAALLVVGVFGTNVRNLFKSANTSFSQGEAQHIEMKDDGGGKDVRINDFSDK